MYFDHGVMVHVYNNVTHISPRHTLDEGSPGQILSLQTDSVQHLKE